MDYKRPLKFELICEDLRSKILLGHFDGEGRLPSEELLAESFRCSRPTIRKALEKLQEDNIIYTIQGSGSFIQKGLNKETGAPMVPSSQSDTFFGLIFPNLGTGYVFDSISNYIATDLGMKGYSLIWGGYLSPLAKNFMQDLTKICDRYIQLGVKGVFFSPFEYTQQRGQANHFVLSTFSQAGIPVVLIDSDVDDFPSRNPYDLVSLDHIAASFHLCEHVLTQGAERLIFLAPPSSMETIRLRVIGYHEALLSVGITPRKEWFIVCDPTDKHAVKQTLTSFNPDGIVCSNDGTAVQLMNTLSELGVAIPEQIKIAAFDNLSYLSDLKIPLTSVEQPVKAIGKIAVQTLLQRIEEPETPVKTIRLSGKLIVRASTSKSGQTSAD